MPRLGLRGLLIAPVAFASLGHPGFSSRFSHVQIRFRCSVLSLTLTGSHSIDFCHSCWQCKNWDESLKSLLDASHGAMAMAIIYMAQNLFSAHPTVWPDRVTCCSDVADIGSGCWHIFCPTSRLHWSQHWLLGHSPAATRLCACGCIQYALLEPDLGTGCA